MRRCSIRSQLCISLQVRGTGYYRRVSGVFPSERNELAIGGAVKRSSVGQPRIRSGRTSWRILERLFPESFCKSSGLGLLACLGGASPSDAQARTESNFAQGSTVAWLAAANDPEEFNKGTLPKTIARLAGLSFQEKADYLTPDLNTALAQSVMSGGKLRESPWGWFALARQLQHSRGTCLPYEQISPRDWFQYCRRVVSAYKDAFKRDSTFLPVLVDLDAAIPWPALWLEPDQELRLLGRALEQADIPQVVYRKLERRRRLVWTSVTPEVGVDSIRALASDSILTPGELSYLEARALSLMGDGVRAVAAYSRTASIDGPGEHLDWIRHDIELIGTPEELAEWDTVPPVRRAAWATAFWNERDFDDGHEPGTRIAQHAERWQHAFQEYRFVLQDARLEGSGAFIVHTRQCPVEEDGEDPALLVLNCNFPDSIMRTRIFDDRGITYLRHGEPQQRANYPGMESLTKASWLYTTEGKSLVIHFDKGINPVARNGMSQRAVSNADWITTCQLVPRYCVLAARVSMRQRIPPEQMRLVLERGTEEIQQLLSTDGAPQRFRNAFAFNAAAYALGSAPGQLTLAVDAPLEALRKLVTTDSTRVSLRWQVRIRGHDGVWPVSSDMHQTLTLPPRASEGDGGKFLTLVREFSVPPGSYDLRLVLSDSAGTTGARYARDGFTMIGGASPNLSDVVLMPEGGQGAARAIEGVPVRISPTFTPGAARFVQVGYLLTGLAGRDVRVTVQVTEVGKGDGEPRIAVTFTERPTSDRDFRVQQLGLERLRNGAWDLTVSVPLPDGTTVTRTQRMVVRR